MNLPTEEVDILANSVAEMVHAGGYPYYRFSASELRESLTRILDYAIEDVIEGDVIKQRMAGMDVMWSYFRHAVNVRNGNNRTPLENFSDLDTFKRVVRKRLKYGDNLSIAAIRKALRLYEGARGVSGFRPTAAAAIYRRYSPPNAEQTDIWDMCGGWGGRLLGAAIYANKLNRKTSMLTNEVETATALGLSMLAADLVHVGKPDVFLSQVLVLGSERTFPGYDKFDVAFTSPPYFNTERYGDDNPNQSYVRFPTYPEWREGFLRGMMQMATWSIKSGGVLALNVANTKTAPTLENDTQEIAHSLGLQTVETLRYAMSGNVKVNGTPDVHKFEPVFVWRKP